MNFNGGELFRSIPDVIKNIIIINVLMYLAQQALPYFGFHITEHLSLFHLSSDLFRPYQIVTYMFLHGSLFHLLSNMIGLLFFGMILERRWGPKNFLFFYLFTGVGSAFFQFFFKEIQIQYWALQIDPVLFKEVKQMGLDLYSQSMVYRNPIAQRINNIINSPMLGASGAIFGIVVGFGYLFQNMKIMLLFPPIPVEGKWIGVIALVMGVVFDTQGEVAHFAHLGGIVSGLLLIAYWKKTSNYF